MNKFANRTEAGAKLAELLDQYADQTGVIILALPRGGVPVAFEIAKKLHLPLDVFIVRKLGVPGHAELAMGALATGGIHIFNEDIVNSLQISDEAIENVIQKEQKELKRREMAYRDEKPFPSLKNKTVILVDDGMATGATMRVAIKSLRLLHPKKIVVAVPVADYELSKQIESLVDEFICPLRPKQFYAVGAWYDDFSQTEDDEVFDLLREAKTFSDSV